ncbi:MAG: rhombosortase [Alcanivoracaceae bacterium]|nr:rhombosortase [Alcanivoracaceae bacterium]
MIDDVIQRWHANRGYYLVVLAAVVGMAVLALFGDSAGEALRYRRDAVADGQWWRLVSCHLVHLNGWHALMNLTGFTLVCLFFDDLLSLRRLALWFLVSAPLVGIAFYLRDTSLAGYVGLSGLLHGLFVMCLLLGIRGQPALHLVVLALVVGRLVYEQTPGYDVNYAKEWIGGRVHVNAHLYGAMVGAVLGGVLWWREHREEKNSPSA